MSNQEPISNATIMLVDNGSTRVDATVKLRNLAKQLSDKTGKKIHAVSLNHSDRISIADVGNKLAGIPARTFTDFMSEQLSKGKRNFILIPLFFGKSRALTSFVTDKKAELESKFGPFKLSMTEVLYPLPEGEPALVEILYEHAISITKGDFNNIVLVDHGSPTPAVNDVRQHIANALNTKLPNGISVNQAVMERRQGKQYDFNGELLKDYLSRLAKSGETHATVLLLFLLPGTHAGENGDIAQICNAVMLHNPNFKISISSLLSQNEKLIDILEQRLSRKEF